MSDVLAVMKKPVWWGLLLFLPVAMGLCLVAANWQHSRYERRSAQEKQAQAAETTAPLPLASVLGPGETLPATEHFTPVTATGTYDRQAVLIRNRSLDDERGLWVVNPLRMADGTTIMVLRGWLAATRDNAQQAIAPAAPAGPVAVTGVLQGSEPKRGAGVLSNGEATSLNTQTLCPEPNCYESYLQLRSSDPADPVTPVPVKGPGLGPHLGYAGQWLIFALLLPIGYVILLRREVREVRESSGALTGSR